MRQQAIAFAGLMMLIVGSLSLAACGTADTEERPGPSVGNSTAVAETAGLPVRAPQGPIDEQLASKGAQLFKERGCVACHTIGGGRLVGPDLEGVTPEHITNIELAQDATHGFATDKYNVNLSLEAGGTQTVRAPPRDGGVSVGEVVKEGLRCLSRT